MSSYLCIYLSLMWLIVGSWIAYGKRQIRMRWWPSYSRWSFGPHWVELACTNSTLHKWSLDKNSTPIQWASLVSTGPHFNDTQGTTFGTLPNLNCVALSLVDLSKTLIISIVLFWVLWVVTNYQTSGWLGENPEMYTWHHRSWTNLGVWGRAVPILLLFWLTPSSIF